MTATARSRILIPALIAWLASALIAGTFCLTHHGHAAASIPAVASAAAPGDDGPPWTGSPVGTSGPRA